MGKSVLAQLRKKIKELDSQQQQQKQKQKNKKL